MLATSCSNHHPSWDLVSPLGREREDPKKSRDVLPSGHFTSGKLKSLNVRRFKVRSHEQHLPHPTLKTIQSIKVSHRIRGGIRGGMSMISEAEVSDEGWVYTLKSVEVPKSKPVYKPGRQTELPDLLSTQVIASRDPRLSPDLPTSSIYSQDFLLEGDWREDGDEEEEEEDTGSFHSEDWYCQDVGDSFEEEARNLKVRIHINPKFFPNLSSAPGKTTDQLEPETESTEVTRQHQKADKATSVSSQNKTNNESKSEGTRKPLYQGKMPEWMKEYIEETKVSKESSKAVDKATESISPSKAVSPVRREDGKSSKIEKPAERSAQKGKQGNVSSESIPVIVHTSPRSVHSVHDDPKQAESPSKQDGKPYSEKIQAWMEATQEFLDEGKKTSGSSKGSKEESSKSKEDSCKSKEESCKGSKEESCKGSKEESCKGSKEESCKGSKEEYCTSDGRRKRSRSRSSSRRRYPARDAMQQSDNQSIMEEGAEPVDPVEVEHPPTDIRTPGGRPEGPKKDKGHKALDKDREEKEEEIFLDPRVPDMYRAEMEEIIQEERRKKREARHMVKAPAEARIDKPPKISAQIMQTGASEERESRVITVTKEEVEPPVKKKALKRRDRKRGAKGKSPEKEVDTVTERTFIKPQSRTDSRRKSSTEDVPISKARTWTSDSERSAHISSTRTTRSAERNTETIQSPPPYHSKQRPVPKIPEFPDPPEVRHVTSRARSPPAEPEPPVGRFVDLPTDTPAEPPPEGRITGRAGKDPFEHPKEERTVRLHAMKRPNKEVQIHRNLDRNVPKVMDIPLEDETEWRRITKQPEISTNRPRSGDRHKMQADQGYPRQIKADLLKSRTPAVHREPSFPKDRDFRVPIHRTVSYEDIEDEDDFIIDANISGSKYGNRQQGIDRDRRMPSELLMTHDVDMRLEAMSGTVEQRIIPRPNRREEQGVVKRGSERESTEHLRDPLLSDKKDWNWRNREKQEYSQGPRNTARTIRAQHRYPPSPRTFKPMSKYLTKVYMDQCEADKTHKRPQIDAVVNREKEQMVRDMEKVYRGNQPSPVGGEQFKHFPPLSLNTELESTFIESPVTKRTYLQELKEWMTKKPLEEYMMGRLNLPDKKPADIPKSAKTNQTLKECVDSFDAEVYTLLKGKSTADPQNVFPCPSNSTEETTDQVFRQVTKYMDFLVSKSFLVEKEQQNRAGSQRLERTDLDQRLLQSGVRKRAALDDRTNISEVRPYDKRCDTARPESPQVCVPKPVPRPDNHGLDNQTRVSRTSGNSRALPGDTQMESRKYTTDVEYPNPRELNRRSGFMDRMEAILADRESENQAPVAKTIPLEPEVQPRYDDLAPSRKRYQRLGQLHHFDQNQILEINMYDTKDEIQNSKSQSQSAEINAPATKSSRVEKEALAKTKGLHVTTERGEEADKTKAADDSTVTEPQKSSSSTMYSPTQPTAPEDLMEYVEYIEHQNKAKKDAKDDSPRKRKAKDADTGISRKKKKDKDKSKDEDTKKEDKKKKEKKEKRKEKDKKKKHSERSRDDGDGQSEQEEIKQKHRTEREQTKEKPEKANQRDKGNSDKERRKDREDKLEHTEKEHRRERSEKVDKDKKGKDEERSTEKDDRKDKGEKDEKRNRRHHIERRDRGHREERAPRAEQEEERKNKYQDRRLTQLEDGELRDDAAPQQVIVDSAPPQPAPAPDPSAEPVDPTQQQQQQEQQDPARLSWIFLQYFTKSNEEVFSQFKDICPDVNTFSSTILDPENSFLWALALAVHEKHKENEPDKHQQNTERTSSVTAGKSESSGATLPGMSMTETTISASEYERMMSEYGTVPEGVTFEMNEYGSYQMKVQISEDKEAGELSPDESRSDERFRKKGSSRLLQAFRQQVVAKKRTTSVKEDKQKHVIKLSAEKAAMKPAPKSAKPLFIPPTLFKPGESSHGKDQVVAASKLGLSMANSEQTDIIIKSAFDIFAEKARDLLKEKFNKEVIDELAKGAQSLLGISASKMKHLGSLSALAFSIYQQYQRDPVNGDVRQDTEKDVPGTADKDTKKQTPETSTSTKTKKARADAQKKATVDVEESHATHMEDRSKITREIMDGHKKLDFEIDKSQKDLSRLKKIGRPSYLFSARIEKLVAEQKDSSAQENKRPAEMVQQGGPHPVLPSVPDDITCANKPEKSTSQPESGTDKAKFSPVSAPAQSDQAEEVVEKKSVEPTTPVSDQIESPGAEEGNMDTSEDGKSKKVSLTLPKGNKLMMAFRQALLAKKKGEKEPFKPVESISTSKTGIKVLHQFGVKAKVVTPPPTESHQVPAAVTEPSYVSSTQTVTQTVSSVTSTFSVASTFGTTTVTTSLPAQSFSNTFAAVGEPETVPATSTVVSQTITSEFSAEPSVDEAVVPSTEYVAEAQPVVISASPVSVVEQVSEAESTPIPASAVISAPPVMSVPPPLPVSVPEPSQGLLPTPPAEPAPAPGFHKTGHGLLPTPQRRALLPTPGTVSTGLLPTPTFGYPPALLPTPGQPPLPQHSYDTSSDTAYSSTYQPPLPDYSQPPPPFPFTPVEKNSDDLDDIPLPTAGGLPDTEGSNLDKSVYDPAMMQQYQKKVREFLEKKKSGATDSSYSQDSSSQSYGWEQYYQQQNVAGTGSSQSFDQWSNQWYNYWNNASQYSSGWGGWGDQWGQDYSQWNNWQQWNQTADVSKPPPVPGFGMPPGYVPPPNMNVPPPGYTWPDTTPAAPGTEPQPETVEVAPGTEDDNTTNLIPRPPPFANNLRVFVFNTERESCKEAQTFLLSVGAKLFDCNNLDLLKVVQFPMVKYLVLIHTEDLCSIHNIPNLCKLREESKVEFATFTDVDEVKEKRHQLIMLHGGILLPDDSSLMGLTPHSLELLMEYMMSEKKHGRSWCLKVHKHIFREIDGMRAQYSDTSMDNQRLVDLAQMLVRYEDKEVVETLLHHQCYDNPRPPEGYLPCCVKLQAEGCRKYRHCYLFSEMLHNDPSVDIFRAHGISVMSLSAFLETVAHKPPAAVLPMPATSYGLQESMVFADAPLSSGTKSIILERPPPSVLMESVSVPAMDAARGEPRPPGEPGPPGEEDLPLNFTGTAARLPLVVSGEVTPVPTAQPEGGHTGQHQTDTAMEVVQVDLEAREDIEEVDMEDT